MVLLKRVREAGIAPVFLMQWTFCLFLVFCFVPQDILYAQDDDCLLYTSPSPRDRQKSRMPSSA